MQIALRRGKALDIRDQRLLFAEPERRPVEGLQLATRVPEVALDAHGAEQNPSDHDLRGIGDELVFDRPART